MDSQHHSRDPILGCTRIQQAEGECSDEADGSLWGLGCPCARRAMRNPRFRTHAHPDCPVDACILSAGSSQLGGPAASHPAPIATALTLFERLIWQRIRLTACHG